MTSQEYRWVLSGGLASGKTQVRRVLGEHGFHTIDADRLGHEVLHSGGPAFDDVLRRWPTVARDGEIDRQALASIVFEDRDELAALEAITHPYIFDRISTQVEGLVGPVVVEIPLIGRLLGSDWRRIVVDCRDEVRLQRAIDRGMAEGDARARLASQPSRTEWLAGAEVVLPNHGDLDELEETVRRWVVEALPNR